jgi:hypothetical protein
MAKVSDNLECEVVALYKVEFTLEEIQARKLANPHWTALTDDYLVELVEKLYIVDLSVSNVREAYNVIGDITQDNNCDQVPFHELYFDETGETNLYPEQVFMPEPPEDAVFPGRLRFFLHYVDVDLPLLVNDIELHFPLPKSMPNKLAQLMPYNPPN